MPLRLDMRRAAACLALACGLLGGRPENVAADAVTPLPAPVYARAGKLLAANLNDLVLNELVVPRWIGSTDEFWYRRETSAGHRFIVVDAATGLHKEAFDHVEVAAALSRQMRKELTPDTLPFRSIAFSESRGELIVEVEGTRYTYSLGSGELKSARVLAPIPGMLVSPDGQSGLATRAGNLWLLNLATGEQRQLTNDGQPDAGYGISLDSVGASFIPRMREGRVAAPVGARWSPNGRHALVPYFDQRHVLPYPFLDSASEDGSLRPKLYSPRLALGGDRLPTAQWYVLDIATGAKRRVDFPAGKLMLETQFQRAYWTKDGAHVFIVAHGENLEAGYLFDIELATGAVRTVVEDRVAPRTDLNTTSYNLPNVWVSDDGADAIWFSQRDGWGHLYRYDARSGVLRNRITRGEWLVRDIIKVDHANRTVYFTGGGREPGNPYHRYLYRVGFDGSGLRRLTSEKADHLLVPTERISYSPDGIALHDPFSPSGRYLVYTYSTLGDPPVCVIADTRNGKRVAMVEEADASRLYAAGWRAPEPFVTKAADGKTDIHGVIYKPSDFDPARRYPVLDAQYASPLISVTPVNFYQSHAQEPLLDQAAYAELGFIVVTLDGRGTTNRSKAFSHVTYGHLNTNGLEDHVAAIRQLAASRSYMDVDRVGIYGVSYGGYITIRAMLEFPELFKVGIATAGIAVVEGTHSDYHWTAFHGKPRYADGSDLRSAPGDTPRNWEVLDARRQAARLQGKLFIQFSELDENVPPGQTMTFIDALIRENKPFDMLYVPSRDHVLLTHPYVVLRSWDFLVKHLLGREPPASFDLHIGQPWWLRPQD